jgi:hypothetical protein
MVGYMSGARRSRVTPSITNIPNCGGSKKNGLITTWGKNASLFSRTVCGGGIRRANMCYVPLKTCPKNDYRNHILWR